MNNFKRMQEEDEARYQESHERRVKSGVVGTLGFLRFVGQLVDIYLPRVVDVFIVTAGGNVVHGSKKHHSDPATSGPDAERSNFAPGPELDDNPA